MSNNEIMVSVVVPTYGHEKYIEKAINSVLMQKVNFNYEVLVGEDCSLDNTREILKAMEPNLPDFVHIFYREKNMGMGTNGNSSDLSKRAKGKYFIMLEGDDYWIDENKLQEQVNFLETHPDYIAVAHNTEIVDQNNEIIQGKSYPECKNAEYTLNDFLDGILCGQTTTILSRKDYLLLPSLKSVAGYPGDRAKVFILAAFGRVYCIQKKMSAYRYITNGGYSYSATVEKNHKASKQDVWKEKSLKMYKNMIEYSTNHIKTKESILVSEKLYYSMLWWAVIEHSVNGVNYKTAKKDFRSCKYKFSVITYVLKKNLMSTVKMYIVMLLKNRR